MRNVYITAGIDEQKVRDEAQRRQAEDGTATTIHHHNAADTCALNLEARQKHYIIQPEKDKEE